MGGTEISTIVNPSIAAKRINKSSILIFFMAYVQVANLIDYWLNHIIS